MDLRLAGKGALVTGSSIGIGEGIARALGREGAKVAVHGRKRDQAERVAAAIRDVGGSAVVVLGDLTSDPDVAHLVDEAERLLGRVDILVNNAGGSAEKHLWTETGARQWAESYDRNVLAAVRVIDLVLPKMRAAGWGRIVNVSSLAGTMPPPTGPDYSACKAAIGNLTVSLAKAAAADGITVNAISPGTILTPKLEAAFRRMADANGWADGRGTWAAVEAAVLPHVADVPLGTVGTVDDIAHAVCFLCSPLAGYVTGVNLRVDGGAMPTTQ